MKLEKLWGWRVDVWNDFRRTIDACSMDIEPLVKILVCWFGWGESWQKNCWMTISQYWWVLHGRNTTEISWLLQLPWTIDNKKGVYCLENNDISDFADMGTTTFWTILKQMSFTLCMMWSNTKVLMERNDIYPWMVCHLGRVREFNL